MPIRNGIFYDDERDGLFSLGDYEEGPRVTFEVYSLHASGEYIKALKAQSKVLQKRRGNCSSWMADNDLSAIAVIANDGNIKLGVPELYQARPINLNSTWRLVDKVVEILKKIE